MHPSGPTLLVILDGFGCSRKTEDNAIAQAHTPHLDDWFKRFPSARLQASGVYVGLPKGYVGNSEVGHLTIGAGRVIPQAITIIHQAIANKTFYENPVLKKALAQTRAATSRLHIIGLCSDAGVHSDIEHMYAFLDAAHLAGISTVFLHLFLDGRDTAPCSAATYLEPLSKALAQIGFGTIGSIHGRFYAMDRNRNFDRTQQSYNVLLGITPSSATTWRKVLEHAYAHAITDEFIQPTLCDPSAAIMPGDGVIFFNVRPDRVRQLTQSLLDPHFTEFTTTPCHVSCFVTPVNYGLSTPTQVMFAEQPILATLKDLLAEAHKRIFVIAETEKYAHVTYFFTGMREQPVVGETRMLIPSGSNRTYAQKPEMAAPEITLAVLNTCTNPYDFYLINYANADMVGHSGNLSATIKAVECLDTQLGLLYDTFVTRLDGTMYVTADHGKAEEMFDVTTQQPKTAHTNNQVPFLMLTRTTSGHAHTLPLSELADIAPFILKNMGLTVPKDMKK